jgi:hypothetical protein
MRIVDENNDDFESESSKLSVRIHNGKLIDSIIFLNDVI